MQIWIQVGIKGSICIRIWIQGLKNKQEKFSQRDSINLSQMLIEEITELNIDTEMFIILLNRSIFSLSPIFTGIEPVYFCFILPPRSVSSMRIQVVTKNPDPCPKYLDPKNFLQSKCCGSGFTLDSYSASWWTQISISNTVPDPHN